MHTVNQAPAEPEPINGTRRSGTALPSLLRRERGGPGRHASWQQRTGNRPSECGALRGCA